MNDATRRFRLFAIFSMLAALALGSFWLVEVMRRSADDVIPKAERTEPDFYVEKFSYVRLSKDGLPQYHFSGAKLTHNPKDDTYDIQQPLINSLGNPAAPTTLRADRAHVNGDNSEVHMYDNVHMDRPASGNTQHLHLKSAYLLLLPDDDIVRTDKPVVINFDASTLTGTGMFANNATRELRLTSNVHGTYQSPAP
jgi:lipopolysaccharide export system protein LptC